MLRLPPLSAACLLLACGQAPTPLPPPPPRVDPAIELADRLPSGFDRCVVVRPRRLSARRRALVTRFSWADPRAFQDGLGVVAFATASIRLPGGEFARRSLYRFARGGTPPRERMGLALDQGAACPGPGCGRRSAEWLDDHTLQIDRHRWPDRTAQPRNRGFWSPNCVSMARSHPDAFEVAVSRDVRRSRLPTPQWTLRSLSGDGGMRMHVERVFSSEEDARRFEQALGLGYEAAGSLSSLPPSDQHIEREVHRVRVSDRHSWDALELALEDQRLRREARRRARRRQLPSPVAEVDVTRLDRVRREMVLHRALLERSGASTRERNARAYATLLDRALRVHANTPELVRERVTLALEELDEAAMALPLIEALLASDAPEQEGWRLLRREVLSRATSETARFATALLEDGVAADAAAAEQAAHTIGVLRGGGMAYETAERAWVLRRELFRGRAALSEVQGAPRIPWASALSTIAMLLRRETGPAPLVLFGLQVRDQALGFGPVGDPTRATRFDLAEDGFVVGATAEGLAGLQRLSRSVSAHLERGALALRVELRDSTGQVSASAAVEGLVTPDGMLELRRVSTRLSQQPWPHVRRYVAQPLASLPPTLFPPPEVRIHADSEELADQLRRVSPEVCVTSGTTVRCTADQDFDALMGALVEAGLEGAGGPGERRNDNGPR